MRAKKKPIFEDGYVLYATASRELTSRKISHATEIGAMHKNAARTHPTCQGQKAGRYFGVMLRAVAHTSNTPTWPASPEPTMGRVILEGSKRVAGKLITRRSIGVEPRAS